MDNAAIMTLLRSRLQIIDGCAQAIDIDTKNPAGTRHKARTIHRVSEELLDEMKVLLRRQPDAHIGARGGE